VSNGKIITEYRIGMLWKEAVATCFEESSRNLLEGTEKNHRSLSQHNLSRGIRDFNPRTPDYERRELRNRKQRPFPVGCISPAFQGTSYAHIELSFY
jgi:hypothetical protein